MSSRFLPVAASVIAVFALVGCTASAPASPGSSSSVSAPPPSPSGTASHTSPHSSSSPSAPPSADPLAGLSLAQRVGQLFIVGTTATAAQSVTLSAIRDRHVGGVFLSGRSRLGVAGTKAVVKKLTAADSDGPALLVSTDQEGGQVQVLQGPGFSVMPTGLAQGALSASALRSRAATWGGELADAGVNLDLAPVVDLIGSAADAAKNPPIGAFQREYGYSAATIVSHADAFRDGLGDAGVSTVIKHFPGLGYVTENTDTHAGVTDDAVGTTGANVGIYRSEIAAGASSIMVSSAIYTHIDPSAPAVFSPKVVTDLLRDQLGFDGVVMTDDMSGATQVLEWSPADRAILAIEAGVDVVLVSKDPTVAAQMIDAVVAKAKADPAFAAKVDAAARRVLALKATL